VNFGLALSVFALLFIAEFPDKTMIATVIMGSRSRPLPVWLGASCAFIVHMALACLAGRFLGLLPHRAVEALITVLFLGGAAYLFFVPEKKEIEEGEREAQPERPGAFVKVAATAFGVIFIGEFGDLTQIITANFVAKTHDILTVFLAASLAMVSVSALGTFGGSAMLRVVPLEKIRKGGALVLAGFGVYSLATLLF